MKRKMAERPKKNDCKTKKGGKKKNGRKNERRNMKRRMERYSVLFICYNSL